MAEKPKIQYVGQFYIHGSEARALAQQEQEKAKRNLPVSRRVPIKKIYVDPVALCGIVVAVAMLVVMVVGAIQISTAWNQYEAMSSYVNDLKRENNRLTHTYRTGYDLAEIESMALNMGLVPVEEVPVRNITVTVPQPVEEPGFWQSQWENFRWFLEGLFA